MRQMPRKGKQMIKTHIAMSLGMVALSLVLVQGASAGCGNTASRLSAFMPEAPAAPANMELQTPRLDVASARDAQESGPFQSRIAGLWSSNVLVGGQVIFQAFESFTGEGLEFLNDNGSTLEGNVCFGTWIAARNTIRIYHPSWNYDQNGNLIGTVIIKTQITLDPGGNTFKGTVVVDSYDLNGNAAAPELQAQVTGKRITAS